MCGEGLRVLGKQVACYPYGYDPRQICDTFLVPSFCMSVTKSDVVDYEMHTVV